MTLTKNTGVKVTKPRRATAPPIMDDRLRKAKLKALADSYNVEDRCAIGSAGNGL